jgi:hypothetical protein
MFEYYNNESRVHLQTNIERRIFMGNGGGFLGKMFDGDMILWFIILFLLLFWNMSGFGAGPVFKD